MFISVFVVLQKDSFGVHFGTRFSFRLGHSRAVLILFKNILIIFETVQTHYKRCADRLLTQLNILRKKKLLLDLINDVWG